MKVGDQAWGADRAPQETARGGKEVDVFRNGSDDQGGSRLVKRERESRVWSPKYGGGERSLKKKGNPRETGNFVIKVKRETSFRRFWQRGSNCPKGEGQIVEKWKKTTNRGGKTPLAVMRLRTESPAKGGPSMGIVDIRAKFGPGTSQTKAQKPKRRGNEKRGRKIGRKTTAPPSLIRKEGKKKIKRPNSATAKEKRKWGEKTN